MDAASRVPKHAATESGQLSFVLVSLRKVGVYQPARITVQVHSKRVSRRHFDWSVFAIVVNMSCQHLGYRHGQSF